MGVRKLQVAVRKCQVAVRKLQPEPESMPRPKSREGEYLHIFIISRMYYGNGYTLKRSIIAYQFE